MSTTNVLLFGPSCYHFIGALNLVSACSTDVHVYLHIERESEIQSEVITADTC